MNNHILLVGAGNLGSRHLQSLCSIETPLIIDVVEPYENSRELAKTRAKEISGSNIHQLTFLVKIPQNNDYSLAIIATLADVRSEILKEIFFQGNKLRHIILEKVLFQSTRQLIESEQLLQINGVQSWVNYPRRMFDVYQNFSNNISDKKIKHFKTSGGAWGLACNSVHFLDLIEYLSHSKITTVDMKNIAPKIHSSKRSGFYEFFGTFEGHLQNGSSYEISCSEMDQELIIELEIENEAEKVVINESRQTLNYGEKTIPFSFPYQSSLTKIVWEDLNKHDYCQLTKLSETMGLNKIFLESFILFQNRISGNESEKLKIT